MNDCKNRNIRGYANSREFLNLIGTLMTRIVRISADRIRSYPFNERHLCSHLSVGPERRAHRIPFVAHIPVHCSLFDEGKFKTAPAIIEVAER